MKFRIALLGVVFCLGAFAQGQATGANTKSTGSANRVKQSATSSGQQSVSGCVDQQNGHYVLRDVQTSQLVSLQAANSDDDSSFAKFVGHKVEASGTGSAASMKVTQIHQIADMCGTGK